MNAEVNYYDFLGVSKHASSADIKAAYRKKSLSLHPDHGGSASQMAQLNGIYETLSDSLKRHDYDLSLRPKVVRPSNAAYSNHTTSATWSPPARNPSQPRQTPPTQTRTFVYASDWDSTGGSARFWRGFAVALMLAALFLGYQVIQIFNPPASSATAVTTNTSSSPASDVGTATTDPVTIPSIQTNDTASSTDTSDTNSSQATNQASPSPAPTATTTTPASPTASTTPPHTKVHIPHWWSNL